MEFRPSGGRLELTGLRIRSEAVESADQVLEDPLDPPVLTSTLLRQMPWHKFLADRRGDLRRMARELIESGLVTVTEGGKELSGESSERVLNQKAAAIEPSPPGRPRKWTDALLEEVAKVYRDAWIGRLRPTAAVQRKFDVSPSMAAKLVTMARRAQLLGETTRGRSGIGPTTTPRKPLRRKRR